MRYNEQAVQPPKKQPKEVERKEPPKRGSYDSDALRQSRDIPWLR